MKELILEMLKKRKDENIRQGQEKFKKIENNDYRTELDRISLHKDIDVLYYKRLLLNEIIDEIDDMMNPITESFDW